MPQLVGTSSKKSLYLFIALLIASTSAFALEYSGVVDVIPTVGQIRKS
jgi:hypothetical protein